MGKINTRTIAIARAEENPNLPSKSNGEKDKKKITIKKKKRIVFAVVEKVHARTRHFPPSCHSFPPFRFSISTLAIITFVMSLFKYFVTLVISQLFPPPLPHLVSSFNAIFMWISTRKKETQTPITRFAFFSFKNSGSFTCLHLKCVFFSCWVCQIARAKAMGLVNIRIESVVTQDFYFFFFSRP
jgi:hypothetical protein